MGAKNTAPSQRLSWCPWLAVVFGDSGFVVIGPQQDVHVADRTAAIQVKCRTVVHSTVAAGADGTMAILVVERDLSTLNLHAKFARLALGVVRPVVDEGGALYVGDTVDVADVAIEELQMCF